MAHRSNSEVTVVFVRSKTGILLVDMSVGYTHVSPGLSSDGSSGIGSSSCCCFAGSVSLFSGWGGINIGLGFMLEK